MDKGSYKNIPVGYVADFMGNIFQLIDQTKWRLRKVSLTYFFFIGIVFLLNLTRGSKSNIIDKIE